MLKNIEKIGKPLSKKEQQAINGGGICCNYSPERNCCHLTNPWDD